MQTERADTDDWLVAGSTSTAWWEELRRWVEWLKSRYVLDHRVIPQCWYLHAALVDVLVALHERHRADHADSASASARAEWQICFLTLERRLREWAARTGCSNEGHRADATIEWLDDPERWAAHIASGTSVAHH